jgi:hypothetical protein
MVNCHVRTCHGLHAPVNGGMDKLYRWAVASRCSVCKCAGFLCVDGCTLRKDMATRFHLKMHHSNKHRHEPVIMGEFEDNDAEDLPYEVDDGECNPPPTHPPRIVLTSTALQAFLDKSIEEGMVASIHNFVCSACMGNRLLPGDVLGSIPLYDTYLSLLIARLVFRIGTVHQVLLSTLLSVFVAARPLNGYSSLPITRAQMIRVITNRTNRTSMASSIPTPRPQELRLRHAYLPLEDAIGHALGLQPATSLVLEKYQRLMASHQGTLCLNTARQYFDSHSLDGSPSLVCGLTFWFDGWDPNSSMSKANKTPIWSGTVTMVFATLDGTIVFVTTRLLASGPGKADHTEVIQHLLDNVTSLQTRSGSSSFWVRSMQEHAKVYPIVLHAVCDQPERRTISGLMAGNSKLHSCFGVSCSPSLLMLSLEACDDCVQRLGVYLANEQFDTPYDHDCSTCLHWTLPVGPGKFAKYQYREMFSTAFPTDAIAGGELNTHAGIVTAGMLINAWEEAYQKWVVLNVWTVAHVQAYFRVLTINKATINAFIDQGRRCQLAYAFYHNEVSVVNVQHRNALEQRMLSQPGDYIRLHHPPMWSLLDLDQMPEAVMHLAMGIVKSVSKFVHNWATSRGKSPQLSTIMNFTITMHRKYCRVGRCPMAAYSPLGKFPGWVADTFRTWWIWMPWTYSCLDSTQFGYTAYQFPPTPPEQWNGKECGAFLSSRGTVGVSKLNAETKKDMVAELAALDNWPPPEITPGACGVTGRDLQLMIWHCHSLFKFLFAEPHTLYHQHAAESHTKLLLSTITKLDRIIHSGTKMPNIYEVKYNFISLPRAVRLLSRFGSARNIQEGGIDGEGIVKMLRPLTPRGLKQHFARNLMDAFHRDLQLEQLCEEVHNAVSTGNQTVDTAGAILSQLVDNDEANLDESEMEPMDHTLVRGIMTDFAEMKVDDEEPPPPLFCLDSQQFKKYKTIASLHEMWRVGLPLSFIIASVDSKTSMGCVVGTGAHAYLVPIKLGRVVISGKPGFPYFNVTITTNQDLWSVLYATPPNNVTTLYQSVLNYGHCLPHLASLENENRIDPVPYAIVTTDAYHMNTGYDFV